MLSWSTEKVQEIDVQFLYNAPRDKEFKKLVEPYLASIQPDEDD